MVKKINVGRKYSGGVFNGLFGNPIKEKVVTEQYRKYFNSLKISNQKEVNWLKREINDGAILFCPGCGINSPTCHARIIEEELK